MRMLLTSLLLMATACTDPAPVATPAPGPESPAPTVEVGRTASVRIVSVAGHPNGIGNAWDLPADQDRIELQVTLEGLGRFEVKAELEALDGDAHREFARTVDLDGEETINVSDFLIPVPGSYRLSIEVVGEGVRSSQTISVRRG